MAVSSLYQAVTSYLPPFLKWTCRKKTMNDLPDECLANIFCQILCPSASPNYVPAPIPFFSAECREDPFLLGQVCRRWRNVALRTAELWCSITIIHPKPCHLHRAGLWMQRSGRRAISITLRQSSNPTVTEFDATLALLSLFSSRADFWQRIELYMNGQFPYILLPRLTDLSRMDTCKLIEVNLSLRSCLPAPPAWDTSTAHLWDLLQNIPSIISLKWNAAVVGSAPLGDNISVIDIKAPISMETLSQVVHSTQTLQNVIIRRLELPSSHPLRVMGPLHAIEPLCVIGQTFFPRLTVLDITASPITSDVSSLLKSITLPSLAYLTLAQVTHDILVHVIDLIRRSECTLEIFGIRIPNFTEPQIMEWLNMDELKQVSCLILEGPITDNILRALHRPAQYGHQPCYFPNLKRLGLGKCVATIDTGLLLRMLGSRFWTLPYIAGPKLPATELEFACITVQEVTPELEAYAKMIKQTTEGSCCGMRELEIMA